MNILLYPFLHSAKKGKNTYSHGAYILIIAYTEVYLNLTDFSVFALTLVFLAIGYSLTFTQQIFIESLLCARCQTLRQILVSKNSKTHLLWNLILV